MATKTLAEHDRQFHPNGYKQGDSCKFRDALGSKDQIDKELGTGAVATTVANAAALQKQGLITKSELAIIDGKGERLVELADEIEDLDSALAILGPNDPVATELTEERDDRMADLNQKVLDSVALIEALKKTAAGVPPPIPTGGFTNKVDFGQQINSVVENADGSLDIDIDGVTNHLTPTAVGGTGAVEGTITRADGTTQDVVIKSSNRQGAKYPVSPEMIANEFEANKFMRSAGLLAPESAMLTHNGNNYLITKKIPNTTPLANTQMTRAIRNRLRSAYPILDLMYASDAFRSDNIRVDGNGNVWFVDNGASFNFKGKGDKREKSNPNWKGFEFNARDNADGDPDKDGCDTSYGALYGASKKVRGYLGKMSKIQMLQEAAKYDFEDLVSRLPNDIRSPGLEKFAKSLNNLSAKYRPSGTSTPVSQSSQPQSAPTSTAQTPAPAAAPIPSQTQQPAAPTTPAAPTPSSSTKVQQTLASMGASNPKMASLYQKVANKMGSGSAAGSQSSSPQPAATPTTASQPAPRSSASVASVSQNPPNTPATPSSGANSTVVNPNTANAIGRLAAANPRMSAVYAKVANKLGLVQQSSSAAATPGAQVSQPSGPATTGTTVQALPTAQQTTASTVPQNKGLQHLMSLIKTNPNLAKTYQAAINKMNAAGIN